jgi:hypothetical protein
LWALLTLQPARGRRLEHRLAEHHLDRGAADRAELHHHGDRHTIAAASARPEGLAELVLDVAASRAIGGPAWCTSRAPSSSTTAAPRASPSA